MKKYILFFCFAFNIGLTVQSQSYEFYLDKINEFLVTFDNGYYGPLSVDETYIYCKIKDGRQSKIIIKEIDRVDIITPKRNVKMVCRTGKCVTGVTGDMFTMLGFSTTTDFDTESLQSDLQEFVRLLKER